MRNQADGAYKWIAHFMCHWSKFHILFPLERKTGAAVADGLERFVFSFLGTPRILHHDNGREFVNEIVRNVVATWPGETLIITGRPRHPQSQGMVEQGNATLKRLIGARMTDWRAAQPGVYIFLEIPCHGIMTVSLLLQMQLYTRLFIVMVMTRYGIHFILMCTSAMSVLYACTLCHMVYTKIGDADYRSCLFTSYTSVYQIVILVLI